MSRAEVYFFTAPWCEPCRQMTPIYGEIALELGADEAGVVVDIIDADLRADLADECGIEALPAAVVRIDGDVVLTRVGALPKIGLRQDIATALAPALDGRGPTVRRG